MKVKSTFGDIDVVSKLEKLNSDFIKNSINIGTGEVFDQSRIKKAIDGIKEIAEFEGYSFIEIVPEIKRKKSDLKIDLDLIINEGPRVYVNSINIEGNTRTLDRVIRREVALSEGDAFNKYSVNVSKDPIRALNFFSKVEIDENRTEYPDKLDIVVSVEEKNTGEASIGAGYSTRIQLLNFGLKETFLEKGQKLNLTTSFSNENHL